MRLFAKLVCNLINLSRFMLHLGRASLCLAVFCWPSPLLDKGMLLASHSGLSKETRVEMVPGQIPPGSAQAPLFRGTSGERLTTFDGSASYMERYRPSRSVKKNKASRLDLLRPPIVFRSGRTRSALNRHRARNGLTVTTGYGVLGRHLAGGSGRRASQRLALSQKRNAECWNAGTQ